MLSSEIDRLSDHPWRVLASWSLIILIVPPIYRELRRVHVKILSYLLWGSLYWGGILTDKNKHSLARVLLKKWFYLNTRGMIGLNALWERQCFIMMSSKNRIAKFHPNNNLLLHFLFKIFILYVVPQKIQGTLARRFSYNKLAKGQVCWRKKKTGKEMDSRSPCFVLFSRKLCWGSVSQGLEVGQKFNQQFQLEK